MKYSANKEKPTGHTLEEAYHQVLIDGPKQPPIPPCKLSPKVHRAIQDTVPSERRSVPLFVAFSPQLRMGFAAFAILFVGAFLFVSYWPSEEIKVESVEVNGQTYQVIWLAPAAAFDPIDLNGLTSPALREEKGHLRQQLGFLTDHLAKALRKSLKSDNWVGVRDALKAQEMELPTTPPKHLVISEKLSELLETEVRDIELWVIQPNASVLLFTTAK